MNDIVTTSTAAGTEIDLPSGYSENASLAVSLARAEVDQQVATSRALPRNLTRVVKNILTLATMDEQSAEECVYALPRGGKPIKGPSIRLAEIIGSQWGNCRIGARVVHVDRFEKFIEAEGVFHDLETNTATTARVRRRISDRSGKVLNEDMIVVTGNAACSIAKRNAILGGVPKAVWRKAYEAVEQVIAGDIATLSVRREKAMKAFAAFGVKPEQVFSALGLTGLDDVNLEHMGTLMGMHSALKTGESTVEEMFPKPQEAQAGGAKGLNAALDKLGSKPESKTAAPKEKKSAEVQHDPETGEIQEEKISETKEDAASAGPSTEPDPEHNDDDLPDERTLLDRGREAALEGTAALLRWRKSLTDAEREEIKADLAALGAAAKQADGVTA